MRSSRGCSRTACHRSAVATLTYVYADSTAVLGPLAQLAEPHTYDLCEVHAERLSAPRGWEVVRLNPEFVDSGPSEDDLLALADAVRASAASPRPAPSRTTPAQTPAMVTTHERGHLRVLRDDES